MLNSHKARLGVIQEIDRGWEEGFPGMGARNAGWVQDAGSGGWSGGGVSTQEGLVSSQAMGCDLGGWGPRGAPYISPSHMEDPNAARWFGLIWLCQERQAGQRWEPHLQKRR